MREFLLEKKRDPEQEYTIHLFEYCNLRCSFCWQDHENRIGYARKKTGNQEIKKKPRNQENQKSGNQIKIMKT